MTRVLIVEDEETLGWTLRDLLDAEGYETDLATNGHDALQRIERVAPDVLLLDLMLPSVDGVTILERTAAAREAGMRVIVMSSADRGTMGAQTCDSFLEKPFALDDVLVAVEGLRR